jgi:hypothetical protein
VAVFDELSGRLVVQLKRVDAVITTEVAAFNRLLARRKLAPIVTTVPTVEEMAAVASSAADLEADAADVITSAKFW